MSGRLLRRHQPSPDIPIHPECLEMVRRGALVALNVSGGKDSQAMCLLLSRVVPHDQLVAVHAPLGEVEWPGTIEHIERTIPRGVPLILAPIASGKTLLERVEDRGRWPGVRQRYCTSEHKTGPIERELRRFLKAQLRPDLYRQYVELERRIGHTLSPTCIPLPQLTGVPVEPAATTFRPCDDVRVDRSPTPSAGP